jgi:hypothetical protein
MFDVPGSSSGEQRPVYVCAFDGSDDCEVVQLSLLEALAYFAPYEQPLQPGQGLPFADLELQGQAEEARVQLLHSMELVSEGVVFFVVVLNYLCVVCCCVWLPSTCVYCVRIAELHLLHSMELVCDGGLARLLFRSNGMWFADVELQGQAEAARLQLLHSMELVRGGVGLFG